MEHKYLKYKAKYLNYRSKYESPAQEHCIKPPTNDPLTRNDIVNCLLARWYYTFIDEKSGDIMYRTRNPMSLAGVIADLCPDCLYSSNLDRVFSFSKIGEYDKFLKKQNSSYTFHTLPAIHFGHLVDYIVYLLNTHTNSSNNKEGIIKKLKFRFAPCNCSQCKSE